jgi:serine/threonine protein kinase
MNDQNEKKYDLVINSIIKDLGKGGFGKVVEVYHPKFNKVLAGKLVERKTDSKYNESDLSKLVRGPHLVKINKIYEEKYDKKEYNFILMEKAPLKDLKTFRDSLRNQNILKLVYLNPFDLIGDNFLRFLFKQVVEGLEVLDRGNYVHFDIKPKNILIFSNMILKLSDFGLLRDIKSIKNKDNKLKIPGGTQGYLSIEYYKNKDHIIHENEANKQDFFALGITLFFIKYGKDMIKIRINNRDEDFDYLKIADYLVDDIQNAMNEIKTTKSSEKDFIDFLISLIQFNAKDRTNFEEIYRNKWINKNWEEILEIFNINRTDEEKLILELDKSDFIIKKKQYLNEIHNKQNNNNINNNGNKEKVHTYNHRNKFIFKI